eukprot:c6326_g1_i1 orf=1-213(-)
MHLRDLTCICIRGEESIYSPTQVYALEGKRTLVTHAQCLHVRNLFMHSRQQDGNQTYKEVKLLQVVNTTSS